MNIKKYTQVSSTQLALIQNVVLLLSIVGAFFVPWSFSSVLVTLFFYYLFMVVGIGVVLHRYWAHKNFEFRHPFLKWMFTFISVIASRGSPIAWVHVHRDHHAYSDTEKDPHRPDKFSFFSFKKASITQFKPFLVKDLLTKEQKFIHEYYLLFILGWCFLLFILSPAFLYFAWILPVCLTQIVQDVWNYWAHMDTGYRNFETKDKSRNVKWLWPFIFGEAWHNNHHHNPAMCSTKVNPREYDPVVTLINWISK